MRKTIKTMWKGKEKDVRTEGGRTIELCCRIRWKDVVGEVDAAVDEN